MHCEYELRLIARIDLDRAISALDDRSFELLVLRNIMGMDWDSIERVTGRNWRTCREDLRQALVALALWLRSYCSRAEGGKLIHQFPRRQRAARRRSR